MDQYFHPGCGSFPRIPVHICLIRGIFCIWPIKIRVTLDGGNPLTCLKSRSTHDPTGSVYSRYLRLLRTTLRVPTYKTQRYFFTKKKFLPIEHTKNVEDRNTFFFTMASSSAFFYVTLQLTPPFMSFTIASMYAESKSVAPLCDLYLLMIFSTR